MPARADSSRDLISEDGALDRATWVVQRVAWAVAAVLLAAALAGLLGRGPLGGRAVTSADGSISVEYDRYFRADTVSDVRVTRLDPVSENTTSPVTLYLRGDGLIHSLQSAFLAPSPIASRAVGDAVELDFAPGTRPSPTVPLLLRLKVEDPRVATLLFSSSPDFAPASTAEVNLVVYP